jgi:hypothetical protein
MKNWKLHGNVVESCGAVLVLDPSSFEKSSRAKWLLLLLLLLLRK